MYNKEISSIMNEIIDQDPDILDGQPVIKGTRIPVSLLKRMIKTGYPDKVIVAEYPSLTLRKIHLFKLLLSSGYNAAKTR